MIYQGTLKTVLHHLNKQRKDMQYKIQPHHSYGMPLEPEGLEYDGMSYIGSLEEMETYLGEEWLNEPAHFEYQVIGYTGNLAGIGIDRIGFMKPVITAISLSSAVTHSVPLEGEAALPGYKTL